MATTKKQAVPSMTVPDTPEPTEPKRTALEITVSNAARETRRLKEHRAQLETERETRLTHIHTLRTNASTAAARLSEAKQEHAVCEERLKRSTHAVTIQRGTPGEEQALIAKMADERALSDAVASIATCELAHAQAQEGLASIEGLEQECTDLQAEISRLDHELQIVYELHVEQFEKLGIERMRGHQAQIEEAEQRVRETRAQAEEAEATLKTLQERILAELKDWPEQRELLLKSHGNTLHSEPHDRGTDILEAWLKLYRLLLNCEREVPIELLDQRMLDSLSLNFQNLQAIVRGQGISQVREVDARGNTSYRVTTQQMEGIERVLKRYREMLTEKNRLKW